jgi:hypothetical protein
MEIFGIVIVAAAAIAGTTWQVARDGLRRVPTRSDTGRCEREAVGMGWSLGAPQPSMMD